MFQRTSVVSLKVAVMLMILGSGMEAAPTERGFVKAPHPLPILDQDSAVPEKSSALNPSHYLKHWLLTTKAAGADGTTRISERNAGTLVPSIKAGRGPRQRSNPGTAGPDKRAQMLKMIAALEELHRMFNSILNSRLTILPRANNRNSGRKNKTPPAADGGLRTTTVAPAAVASTASRASADVFVPSLSGRNFKKSLPPQNKKTNKRVCFWKYCSQN